nr:endonuclease/exonuclease/phosphatase family protein [Herbidospora daliensis]
MTVWRRGPVLTALALLLGLLLLLHPQVTERGGLGNLVDTALPWSGAFIPVLLAGALRRRSISAALALLLPAGVWLGLFGGLLLDKSRPGGDLAVVTHNVGAENPDPAGTARALAASGAHLLALEEITPQARPVYERELAATYPHHTVQGTVGLWSRLPLGDTRPVDLEMNAGPMAEAGTPSDDRALRTTVTTGKGPLVVYVAHLGSVRVFPANGFWTDSRDRGAHALAKAVAADGSERIVLLGDLNGTTGDRAFTGLTAQLRSVQEAAGEGFGFSFPAAFPVVRIDQVLVRGVEPTRSWTLPSTGSDHLPVAAVLAWDQASRQRR